jgi:cholesterol transport system auxiliary component
LSPNLLKRRFGRLLCCALLSSAAAACMSSTPATTYDLTAPRQGARSGGALAGQLAIAEPVSIQALEAERIIVKDASGAVSFLGGGQWADRLPRLVQARLVQTFENGSRIQAVARSGDRIVADYQLTTDIRAFQIESATGEAVVEISARMIQDRTGRILGSRIFASRVPVGSVNAANAAQALDRALSNVLTEIVQWVGTGRSAPASRQAASAPL